MYLEARRLRLPNITGFVLTSVDLLGDDDLVKGFLESCPSLKGMSLLSCFMNELDLLYISCPKLESLRIENNKDDCMCDVFKICCPKLVDLDLKGLIAYNIFFERLDSLKEAAIQPKMEGNTISDST